MALAGKTTQEPRELVCTLPLKVRQTYQQQSASALGLRLRGLQGPSVHGDTSSKKKAQST